MGRRWEVTPSRRNWHSRRRGNHHNVAMSSVLSKASRPTRFFRCDRQLGNGIGRTDLLTLLADVWELAERPKHGGPEGEGSLLSWLDRHSPSRRLPALSLPVIIPPLLRVRKGPHELSSQDEMQDSHHDIARLRD